MVQRELKRSRLVAKYADKRRELKAIIKSADATYDEKMAAVEQAAEAAPRFQFGASAEPLPRDRAPPWCLP